MYNEEVDAKRIYENGFINNEYNFHESVLVAKHFRHILGYGDARVKSSLKEFCKNNDKFFNEIPNLFFRIHFKKSWGPFTEPMVLINTNSNLGYLKFVIV